MLTSTAHKHRRSRGLTPWLPSTRSHSRAQQPEPSWHVRARLRWPPRRATHESRGREHGGRPLKEDAGALGLRVQRSLARVRFLLADGDRPMNWARVSVHGTREAPTQVNKKPMAVAPRRPMTGTSMMNMVATTTANSTKIEIRMVPYAAPTRPQSVQVSASRRKPRSIASTTKHQTHPTMHACAA